MAAVTSVCNFHLVFLLWAVISPPMCRSLGEREDSFLPANKKAGWVDPDDMFGDNGAEPITSTREFEAKPPDWSDQEEKDSYFGKLQEELKSCRKKIEKSNAFSYNCPREKNPNIGKETTCDAPLFKHVLRSLSESINRLGSGNIQIHFTEEQIQTLKTYIETEKGNIHDVSEMIDAVFTDAKLPAEIPSGRVTFFLHYLKHEFAPVIAIVTVSTLVFALIQLNTSKTWRQQILFVLLLGLFISIPWEWVCIYRKEFAMKQLQASGDIPKHCITGNITAYEAFSNWMRNTFTFSEDPCYKYQEALLVDPLWEVSPLQAISVSLTKFCVKPMQHVAESSGKSFRALFNEIPVQWQPFVFIATAVLLVWLIIAISGAKIWTPLLQINFERADQNNVLQGPLNELLQLVKNNKRKEEENRKYLQVIHEQIEGRIQVEARKCIENAQEDDEQIGSQVQEEDEKIKRPLENVGLSGQT